SMSLALEQDFPPANPYVGRASGVTDCMLVTTVYQPAPLRVNVTATRTPEFECGFFVNVRLFAIFDQLLSGQIGTTPFVTEQGGGSYITYHSSDEINCDPPFLSVKRNAGGGGFLQPCRNLTYTAVVTG